MFATEIRKNRVAHLPRYHFNQERHLITRQVCKQRRSIALAEWRALAPRALLGSGRVVQCVGESRYFDDATGGGERE
jgi:hypothetical protein